MMASDHKERRGEPVLLHRDGAQRFAPPLLGTIEWGSDALGYSICTEPAGARFQASAGSFVADPGGSRPLWERRRAEDGETARKAAQASIDRRRAVVVEAAMAHAGFRDDASAPPCSLKQACEMLRLAERNLAAVTRLGVRTTVEP